MKRRILTLIAGLLTLLAVSGAASACQSILYQPELPKALRK